LNPVSFAIAIRVLQVPHVGLVNLIAEREVAPEFLQGAATPAALAEAVLPLLDPASAAARRQRDGLALVRERLGPPGAAERVAALAAELAELSGRWGYRVVRGSSRRGGDVGLLGLVRHLRQGGEVALTPDGPRGPAERMKPGALAAAQHANALVIATGARTSSAWWLRSWDRI